MKSGSKDARTRGAPVVVFVPSAEVLSLKQCAAVSITVEESSVPEQENSPLSS